MDEDRELKIVWFVECFVVRIAELYLAFEVIGTDINASLFPLSKNYFD